MQLYPCTIADMVSGVVEWWFYNCTIVLFMRSSMDKHPMPSNSSEMTDFPSLCSFFIDIQMKWQLSINFSFSLKLLVIFTFWWRQLLVRVLLMRVLLMIIRTSFVHNLSCNTSFLFVKFIALHLFFQNLCLILKTLIFLSMVLHTWTNISISNWHILIPCYHQNSKVVLLNTFCSNRLRNMRIV